MVKKVRQIVNFFDMIFAMMLRKIGIGLLGGPKHLISWSLKVWDSSSEFSLSIETSFGIPLITTLTVGSWFLAQVNSILFSRKIFWVFLNRTVSPGLGMMVTVDRSLSRNRVRNDFGSHIFLV